MILSEPGENKLADGSKTYDLFLWDPDQPKPTIFHCISEAHAQSLTLALKQHTVDFE